MLQELSLLSGHLSVNNGISYASQKPWLFPASIRDNILFGQPYDENRYNMVITVCALKHDFQQLPYGDNTFIGDRGVSLSGGQKSRINLARAVYLKAAIYILDDPLSAVDTNVGGYLFEECISTYLKGTTRILVTHQLQYIQNADVIVVMKKVCIYHSSHYSINTILTRKQKKKTKGVINVTNGYSIYSFEVNQRQKQNMINHLNVH